MNVKVKRLILLTDDGHMPLKEKLQTKITYM